MLKSEFDTGLSIVAILPVIYMKNNLSFYHRRFEVIATVTMKIAVFCDVAPRSLVECHQCFGGICCHHLQDRGVRDFSSEDVSSGVFLNVGNQMTGCYIPEDNNIGFLCRIRGSHGGCYEDFHLLG
jgi:hypothetical protein